MSFKDSLAKGKTGESLFLSLFPKLKQLSGRKSDFCNPRTGLLIELKSDFYNMEHTENFFIELYSDIDRKKVGGPRQAAEHGTDLWAYLYMENSAVFFFKVSALVRWLDQNESKYKPLRIMNKGWITSGILVKRDDLKHLYKKITFKQKSLAKKAKVD